MPEITANHPRRFEGITKQYDKPPDFVICGRCEGHGSYNLKLDQYGPGLHFRALCPSCDGHGFRHKDACEDHKFIHLRKLGRCIEEMMCTVCSTVRVIDSSD